MFVRAPIARSHSHSARYVGAKYINGYASLYMINTMGTIATIIHTPPTGAFLLKAVDVT